MTALLIGPNENRSELDRLVMAAPPANSHHCSADCVAFTSVFPVFVA